MTHEPKPWWTRQRPSWKRLNQRLILPFVLGRKAFQCAWKSSRIRPSNLGDWPNSLSGSGTPPHRSRVAGVIDCGFPIPPNDHAGFIIGSAINPRWDSSYEPTHPMSVLFISKPRIPIPGKFLPNSFLSEWSDHRTISKPASVRLLFFLTRGRLLRCLPIDQSRVPAIAASCWWQKETRPRQEWKPGSCEDYRVSLGRHVSGAASSPQ